MSSSTKTTVTTTKKKVGGNCAVAWFVSSFWRLIMPSLLFLPAAAGSVAGEGHSNRGEEGCDGDNTSGRQQADEYGRGARQVGEEGQEGEEGAQEPSAQPLTAQPLAAAAPQPLAAQAAATPLVLVGDALGAALRLVQQEEQERRQLLRGGCRFWCQWCRSESNGRSTAGDAWHCRARPASTAAASAMPSSSTTPSIAR